MRIPTYRKHSSGQARVTIGGKDYLLGEYDSKKSRQEYARLIAEYVASDGSKHFNEVPEDISILEILVGYKKHIKARYKTNPKRYYLLTLAIRPLQELYGSLEAATFGPKQFKACRRYVMDGKLAGPKAPRLDTLPSRTYVNDAMTRMIQVFQWAGEEELIPASVGVALSEIKLLRFGEAPEPEDVEAVDRSVVDATLPHLPEVIADMVRVQMDVGCRPGELCKITPAMIDKSLEESKGVWIVTLKNHKTAHKGKKRFLCIGIASQNILRPYLLRGENDCLFRPCDSERKRRAAITEARETPLSCGNIPGSNKKQRPARKPGTSYNTNSYAKAIARVCEANGIEHWSPNQLRHTFAMETNSVEDLAATAALMGHASVSTTQIYAKLSKTTAIEAVQRKNQSAQQKHNSAS